jgi:hypothetical protein
MRAHSAYESSRVHSRGGGGRDLRLTAFTMLKNELARPALQHAAVAQATRQHSAPPLRRRHNCTQHCAQQVSAHLSQVELLNYEALFHHFVHGKNERFSHGALGNPFEQLIQIALVENFLVVRGSGGRISEIPLLDVIGLDHTCCASNFSTTRVSFATASADAPVLQRQQDPRARNRGGRTGLVLSGSHPSVIFFAKPDTGQLGLCCSNRPASMGRDWAAHTTTTR